MRARRPEFIYFDLGMVLVTFSIERMCRQMGQVAGVASEVVEKAVFGGDLQGCYERGGMTTVEFYEAFCGETGTCADFAALEAAAADIFEVNAEMLPLVNRLERDGWPLGILSNTCVCHWEHCLRRFRVLDGPFRHYALSYQLKAVKPDPEIFQKAARLAGVEPGAIFYTDDVAGHVAGARAAGYDAVVFEGAARLAAELRQRGVEVDF